MHQFTLAVLSLLPLLTFSHPLQPFFSPLRPRQSQCSLLPSVITTFYGYPDNDPPGAAIAFACRPSSNYLASGTGTYESPLTMASAPGSFLPCELVYAPYLKKYLLFEDYCAQCVEDWTHGQWHVDVWTGSPTVNGGDEQIECENQLTPEEQVIVRNPGKRLEVDATELYVKGASPACRVDHTYQDYDSAKLCT